MTERLAAADRVRPNARRRGYDSDWEAYRADYLRRHPTCACGAQATLVDHIHPVSLGGAFWDPSNHAPMCRRCHASKTMREVNGRRGRTNA
jgi:5-methylcytosine-specific restriction protein A